MLISVAFDANSVIVRVKILDSTVTTGAGKTGLTFESSGLIISTIADVEATATTYTVAAGKVEDITTLGTYAAPTATKCRFKEVDSTNHKGIYELHFADARYAVASSKYLLVSILGATGAAQCDAVVNLHDDVYARIGTNGAGLTALPWNVSWDAEVESECNDALVAYDPPTKAELDTAVGNFGGSGLVGNTVSAGTAELGAGASATSDLYNGMTLVILSGTGVGQSRIVTDYDGATKVATVSPNWTTTPAENDTYILIGTPPAPILTGSLPRVDIREWLGAAVATPAVAGRPSVDTIAVSGDTTAADNLEAACDGTTYNIGGGAVVAASVTGAVGSVTGAVGSVTGAVGSVTGAVGSVTGAVGSVTGNVGGNVTGSVGSLAAQAKADVNAEVVDALATDTYAEPGQGAPAATATLAAKLNYLYKAWRNKKVQDATTWELYADNASTVDQKAAVSDDGTDFTVGEIASGA